MLDRLTDNLEIWSTAAGEPRRRQEQDQEQERACGAIRERTMAAETIGFVGTGRMGGPMAGRLLDAGYSLCVYDPQTRRPSRWLRAAHGLRNRRPKSHRARISCWPACRPPTS